MYSANLTPPSELKNWSDSETQRALRWGDARDECGIITTVNEDLLFTLECELENMSQFRQRGVVLSVAAGAVAAFTALWMRQGRQRRLALAGQIGQMTQQSVDQLGVAAQSTILNVNGLRLHSVVAGPETGPLVVMLHGFPENWTAWRHSFRPLVEAGYRVMALDQRGYNLSDKPAGVHNYRLDALAADIRELVRMSGRGKAIVVGHDWGGAVAWQVAMEYPEVVEKLVIMNSPHPAAFMREIKENPAQQRRSWYLFFFQLPWLPELLLGQSPLDTARIFFRLGAVNQTAYSSYDLHVLAASMSQPGALTAMLNYNRALFRYRPAGVTKAIDASTLVIWGEADLTLGKSLTYGLEQWVPHVKIHYLPDCGHWVQNEAPEQVNEKLLAFLRE